MRDFMCFHFLKVLLALVVLQLGFFSWLQYRNHRPEALTDEYSVFEGHSVTFQPLRNDSDKDEDELLLESVDDPQHGKIIKEDNKLVYSAIKGFVGVDSFTYTINDGKKESKNAFIKVTVNENLKPTAKNDVVQLYQGHKVTLSVLSNDEDREGDSLFIAQFSKPVHGELVQNGNELIYKPQDLSLAKDSFHYSVSDGFSISENATVILTIRNKNNACYPWLSADVGNSGIKGSLECANKHYVVKASGSDIWGNSDHFHFAYQTLNGDGEIRSKIVYIDSTHQWAKAGLMIRETLSGNSKNAFIAITAGNGATMQIRSNTGSGSNSPNQVGDIKAPYWIKLVREKDNFSTFISPDGKNWSEAGNGSVSMPQQVYIGLAVTSHDNEKIGTVRFNRASTVVIQKTTPFQ